MKIRDRMARFFERNERDFNRLMEILEKEDVIFDSPALSILYTSCSVRRERGKIARSEKERMDSVVIHPYLKDADAGRKALVGNAVLCRDGQYAD